MTGIYLECDACKAQFPPKEREGQPRNYHRSHEYDLRRDAAALGWVFNAPGHDLCPACAAKIVERVEQMP